METPDFIFEVGKFDTQNTQNSARGILRILRTLFDELENENGRRLLLMWLNWHVTPNSLTIRIPVMNYLPAAAILIAGVTYILFPSQWKTFLAEHSNLGLLRNFWRKQSDVTVQVLGVIFVLLALYVFLTLKTGG